MSRLFRGIRGWMGSGGFTILELLAVFALLAVIAALVVPKYSTVVAESKIKACDSNVEMLTKAAEMFNEVNKTWPATETELASAGYINEYVYCPVATVEDETTNYTIANGAVTCDNDENHDQ